MVSPKMQPTNISSCRNGITTSLLQCQVNSAFYSLWDGKMSISLIDE